MDVCNAGRSRLSRQCERHGARWRDHELLVLWPAGELWQCVAGQDLRCDEAKLGHRSHKVEVQLSATGNSYWRSNAAGESIRRGGIHQREWKPGLEDIGSIIRLRSQWEFGAVEGMGLADGRYIHGSIGRSSTNYE